MAARSPGTMAGMNERMKLYLISGLMRLVRPLAKNMLISREKKKANKTRQINKIIEKEKEIQKPIYSIKPKNYVT